jgi:hypothetical protein
MTLLPDFQHFFLIITAIFAKRFQLEGRWTENLTIICVIGSTWVSPWDTPPRAMSPPGYPLFIILATCPGSASNT